MLSVILGLLLIVGATQAAAPPVPAELEPWRAWVLKGEEYRRCPFIADADARQRGHFICAWPGRLTIHVDDRGADLRQHWRVDADSWVPLPGDDEHWPQQVTVNGTAAPVVDLGIPMLRLVAGSHEVQARLHWAQRPRTLRVPEMTALLALTVDGVAVLFPQRDGREVTLRGDVGTASAGDSVELRVFRKYSDSIPGELETRVRILAWGQPREEVFGPALPDGFAPLALDGGAWPARLDEHGLLRVQVQPGSNELRLAARATAPMDALVAHLPQAWADQEIWSFEDRPTLRTVTVGGAVQVDPRQVDVPREWLGLPAWALSDGGTLAIEQRTRGTGDDVANRLTLRREAWLDFSGRGWFARDAIRGRMHSDWRFDAAAPFLLQRATAGGANGEALLITHSADGTSRGVEWRTPAVDLHAGLRIDGGAGALPVSGWQQVFDRVTTQIHLPHGHRLIAAPGTDRGNGSWLSSWSLLDVFIAAILTVLAGRLLGRSGAVIAVFYLLLGYQEPGAPLWTVLLVLALALMARALPAGRLVRVVGRSRWVAIALLVLVALPFAANQLRLAVYPQLESRAWFHDGGAGMPALMDSSTRDAGTVSKQMAESAPPAPPAPPPPPAFPSAAADQALESVVASRSRIRRADMVNQYRETMVVQTGAGEPSWQLGSRHTLDFSGPVLPTQQVRLLIAPPWLVRPLRVLLAGMLGLLLWRLVRASPPPRAAAPATSAAAVAMALAMLLPVSAQAQGFPSEALLQQLRETLTEAPRCAPQCASIAQAQVSARDDEIRVVLEVHALDRVAVPLPMDETGLVLRSLTLDGVDSVAIRSSAPDVSRLAVERGVHRVEMSFLPAADHIALAFALAPHRVLVDAPNWEAGGLSGERLVTGTLALARLRETSGQPMVASAQQFAPYVRVTRELYLDASWRVSTVVQRLAPRTGGFMVSVPLLAGEHVVTPDTAVHDGQVAVALDGDAAWAGWDSTLDPGAVIELTAPPLTDHAEVWRVVASPAWHVGFSGVPETAAGADVDLNDVREFVFHPLPGETLQMHISRPAPAEGATRAIDRLDLTSAFGQRAATHTLRLGIRASQGGAQTIHLPADAELIGVSRDGVQVGLRMTDDRLSLPLAPGTQDYEVRFREHAALPFVAHTPAISLGLPAANINLAIELPVDRWLLAAFGTTVGPALLLWGELVVMVILAWLLSRWKQARLRFHHWLLLGLGFSTFSWIALAIVVVWLLALELRARHAPAGNWQFNLAQTGLAVLTIVALGCLFASIKVGLLGSPDMVVSGNGSSADSLRWFADRSVDALPGAKVISLPLWTYNLTMLAWALWLAWATVGWLRNGFAAWTAGGYWRARRRKASA